LPPALVDSLGSIRVSVNQINGLQHFRGFHVRAEPAHENLLQCDTTVDAGKRAIDRQAEIGVTERQSKTAGVLCLRSSALSRRCSVVVPEY
jgi:hypothetical protein